MKISIIGAGNVGATTAMRLVQEDLGEIVLLDIVKGLAKGKSLDLEDSRPLLKNNYNIEGSDDFASIANSDITVITAGLPRKPGMTREELIHKNAQIIKEVCLKIKELASHSTVIVVTNPLDAMTYFALKILGSSPGKVMGMGITLDASRFANIIAKEFKLSVTDIEPCVIGIHGEGMLPLSRLTKVKGVPLDEFTDEKKVDELVARTVGRGLEIVSLLGSGSAYFAPSAAITGLVKNIVKASKTPVGVSAFLNGEYGLKDICIGVPARLGNKGIEDIVELDLNKKEKDLLIKSAEALRVILKQLPS